jgi:hypothetical protein
MLETRICSATSATVTKRIRESSGCTGTTLLQH